MCIQGPTITAPTLGGGLSIAPIALPAFSGDLGLCCKTIPYSTPPIPLPLPAGAITVLGAVMGTAVGFINDFIDGFVPDCPLE